MPYLCYGILIFILFIIQGRFNYLLSSSHMTIDFLLVIVTALGAYYGKTVGGITGFITGFLQDLFSGGIFGIHALSKTVIGYLFGFLKRNIYYYNWVVPPLSVFVATIINQFLIRFFSKYLITAIKIKSTATSQIILLSICNAIVSLIIYFMVYKIDSYLNGRKGS